MIERVVLVKLKDEFAVAEQRAAVASHSRGALAAVPGVRDVTVACAADEACAGSWDLCLTVRFASLDDVVPYVSHRLHRSYVDEFLLPKTERIKAWNFETRP